MSRRPGEPMIPFKHLTIVVMLGVLLVTLGACQSDASDQEPAASSPTAPSTARSAPSTLPPTWTAVPTESRQLLASPLPSATIPPVASVTPETAEGTPLPVSGDLVPSATTYGVFTGNYGTISGSFQSTEQWDITACDLTIAYTLDMSANKRAGGTLVGVTDGAKGWMNASAVDAARTDDALKDPDDRLLLESRDHNGEATYNVLDDLQVVQPPLGNPQLSYGIWFDRDGVAPEEITLWGAVDGATYNTSGVYTVSIVYHSFDNYSGTMFATVNGLQTGFYESNTDGAPDHYPVGKTFTGERLYAARVFATVNSGQTKVTNLTVTGCLTRVYVEIDLLPGDELNCINNGESGPISVAILGERNLNVNEINPDTLVFEGLGVAQLNGQPQAYATHVNDDDFADLLVQFDRAGKVWPADQDYVVLEGQLWDHTSFQGSDFLCIE
jgi:hypothetical protein